MPLNLLPIPQRLTESGGTFAASDRQLILLDGTAPQGLRFSAARLQQALSNRLGLTWELAASSATPRSQIAATLRVTPDKVSHAQGYELSITPGGITVEAHDEPGIFYGVCTLIQIIEQSAAQLPCLRIEDW